MPRGGVEAKPRWASVPSAVRRQTEALLGGRVVRATRAWGGYGPSPTFRLRLDDGRRAFFKAATPEITEFARIAHHRELRVYQELGDLIGAWSPALLGAFDAGEWRVMLLEDLGPKSAPPWTPGLARHVVRALGEFHASLSGRTVAAWVPRPAQHPAMGLRPPAWDLTKGDVRRLAALAGRREPEAREWLGTHLPTLAVAARRIDDATFRHSLLHVDVRSDNLRWLGDRLYLFDWPHVGVGPPEFDAAAFAQTVVLDGGPDPETVMTWYADAWKVDYEALDASVASIAGYFARNAWLPAIPELPRVRAFQRAQLAVTLRWCARRLELPDPTWADEIAAPGRTG